MNSLEKLLAGKRILITGAGGSIGSELVRQCLTFKPSEIICLDISEENIFKLEQLYKNNQHKKLFIKLSWLPVNRRMNVKRFY